MVRLRTSCRGEDVDLFQGYNALTHNCTTAVRGHLVPYVNEAVWGWQILLNGKLDESLEAIGAVRQDLPLAELRARGHVNNRARAAERDPDFSGRIREGMPARFSARSCSSAP